MNKKQCTGKWGCYEWFPETDEYFYRLSGKKIGFRNNCKSCWNDKANIANRIKRRDGKYHVYYLPEEHYVGITDCVNDRMYSHDASGKIIENYEIIYSTVDPTFAVLLEALLHNLGYRGSAYENARKSKVNSKINSYKGEIK